MWANELMNIISNAAIAWKIVEKREQNKLLMRVMTHLYIPDFSAYMHIYTVGINTV